MGWQTLNSAHINALIEVIDERTRGQFARLPATHGAITSRLIPPVAPGDLVRATIRQMQERVQEMLAASYAPTATLAGLTTLGDIEAARYTVAPLALAGLPAQGWTRRYPREVARDRWGRIVDGGREAGPPTAGAVAGNPWGPPGDSAVVADPITPPDHADPAEPTVYQWRSARLSGFPPPTWPLDGWRARMRGDGRVYVRASGAWTIDPDPAATQDEIVNHGLIEQGDYLGPWLLDELAIAVNALAGRSFAYPVHGRFATYAGQGRVNGSTSIAEASADFAEHAHLARREIDSTRARQDLAFQIGSGQYIQWGDWQEGTREDYSLEPIFGVGAGHRTRATIRHDIVARERVIGFTPSFELAEVRLVQHLVRYDAATQPELSENPPQRDAPDEPEPDVVESVWEPQTWTLPAGQQPDVTLADPFIDAVSAPIPLSIAPPVATSPFDVEAVRSQPRHYTTPGLGTAFAEPQYQMTATPPAP